MKKLVLSVIVVASSFATAVHADVPYNPNATPSCKQAVDKGAKKDSLNKLADAEYLSEVQKNKRVEEQQVVKQSAELQKQITGTDIKNPKVFGASKNELKSQIDGLTAAGPICF